EETQHALQIGHRHVAIDEQALDLMEHWKMRRVGIVWSVDTAQRDHPYRRARLLHDSNLHGARLAAKQHWRIDATLGRGQVEVFEWIAGRVRRGNIERLEIVPLVLDLWTLGHREPEPAHDLLEFFDCLRQGMQMP